MIFLQRIMQLQDTWWFAIFDAKERAITKKRIANNLSLWVCVSVYVWPFWRGNRHKKQKTEPMFNVEEFAWRKISINRWYDEHRARSLVWRHVFKFVVIVGCNVFIFFFQHRCCCSLSSHMCDDTDISTQYWVHTSIRLCVCIYFYFCNIHTVHTHCSRYNLAASHAKP